MTAVARSGLNAQSRISKYLGRYFAPTCCTAAEQTSQRRPLGSTHLYHLDADEGVKLMLEFLWQIAVVEQMYPDPVREALGGNTLLRERLLLDR